MMFRTDLPLGGESGIIGNSVALRKRSGRVDWVRSAHLRVDLTFRDIPRPVSAIGFVPHIWAWWCKTVHSGAVRCIWIRFAHPRIRLHQVAWGCTGLHGVAQDSGCPTTFFRLRRRGSTRVGPRRRKRDARKHARLLLHPNRARFGQQSRTMIAFPRQKRGK